MRIFKHKSIGFYLAICLLLMVQTSCKKDENYIHEIDTFFDVDIPAGLNTIQSHFFIVENVPTFINGLYDGSSFTEDDVVRVVGATANFRTTFSNLDLDFIERVRVHALDPNDHSIRKEIFYLDVIPFGNKSDIDLIPSIVNVAPYFSNDLVDLELMVDFRGFAPAEIDARVEMKLFVYDEQ